MSYNSLLKHRCALDDMVESFTDGIPSANWSEVATNIRCFIDLNFIRRGKDPIWTPETGRASDRSGVLFIMGVQEVRSGMRVRMLAGPTGNFLIEGAVDEAWVPSSKHHIEVGVVEIPSQISKGQGVK